MAFGLYYPAYTPGLGSKPRFQSIHPFRNLVAAGSSHMNNQWDNGQSGYGLDPPDYDYHSGPPAHVPSGGSYSYHAATGTGYGPPAAPAIHPPVKPAGGGGKKGIFGGGGGGGGKKGSSAMSALTLLSFLFFINLLQGCIKDHMDAMNPTVMVMTANIRRNRFNKMGEMNSREQKLAASNAANIVVQAPDSAAAASAPISTGQMPSQYSNKINPYNKPLEPALPPPQPPPQYMQTNLEPEIPVTYSKPYHDPHKPDAYEQLIHLPAPQQTLAYSNHSLDTQMPFYNTKPGEQQYTYHHTEYNALTRPQIQTAAPIINSQYSLNQNPFYENQHPATSSKPYQNELGNVPYGAVQYDYHYHQPETYNAPSVSTNNAYPWSTNLHTSASVVSGPYRRASIVSVTPKTKWISVPAKITDRTNFDMNSRLLDDKKEEIVHHDDRDAFRSRLK